MEPILHRRVLLGVTGSIAAYKTAWLVRDLVKAGAEVQVVMTPAAHDFVTPLTLATLSKRPVLTDLFLRNGSGSWNDHVSLGRWADVLVVAPASAHTLAKMAQGLCDNLLLATWLSATCPVYVAPAMDLEMFADPATAHNLDLLRQRGVHTIGPESGELASGLEGAGRMTEPMDIVHRLATDLMEGSPLAGKRILVTAGPTREAIDPVRYIGNRSSGRMGFAIAEEAAARGARVELVTGPVELTTDRPGIVRTDVESAADMAQACKERAPEADIVIMSAAVADHRPAAPAGSKIKKDEGHLELVLERTEDILAWIGKRRRPGQVIAGFALETEEGLESARGKLERKGLDLVVLNSLQDEGAGFGHATNKVTLVTRDKDPERLPLLPKAEVARRILDAIERRLKG
ncbi:MAG TPA: bifunctional phosphopantothenoylcysteine decarboxylase/phosphopantothenate--cysteine ligase CoaBC [Flavobacteriales bacterium]|nr:bifunctional phosphopantothenoylcysteine decarboxylase/phosphopantothenate--cysteine ligase CoaBC [Flavobacteriales bacterium]